MNLYNLNFKKILIILSSQSMRDAVLDVLTRNDIEADIKFVDSYSGAAKLLELNKHNPYDNVILKTQISNSKFKDFFEYLTEIYNNKDKAIISFDEENKKLTAI